MARHTRNSIFFFCYGRVSFLMEYTHSIPLFIASMEKQSKRPFYGLSQILSTKFWFFFQTINIKYIEKRYTSIFIFYTSEPRQCCGHFFFFLLLLIEIRSESRKGIFSVFYLFIFLLRIGPSSNARRHDSTQFSSGKQRSRFNLCAS